jgi:hypothetical protein
MHQYDPSDPAYQELQFWISLIFGPKGQISN